MIKDTFHEKRGDTKKEKKQSFINQFTKQIVVDLLYVAHVTFTRKARSLVHSDRD